MTTEQHLDEEIICFLKSVFSDTEGFVKHIDYILEIKPDIWTWDLRNQIIQAGYDGTFESILFNDMLWDNLCINILVQYFWHNKIRNYQYTIVERRMIPNLFDYYDRHMNLHQNILYCIQYKWDELFKEEIKTWAQMEFSISPK